MFTLKLRPPSYLTPYVEYYQYTSTEQAIIPFVLNAISNGMIELFFLFDDSLQIIYSKNYCLKNKYVFFVGVHNLNACCFLNSCSPLRYLSVLLKPHGFFQLFKVKENVICNRVVEGDTIFPLASYFIWEKLQSASNPTVMISIIDNFLKKQLAGILSDSANLCWVALNQMIELHGSLSVRLVCKKVGLSERTLERFFLDELGITPKEYNMILQINHLFNLACQSGGTDNFCKLSVDAGYFDQSHFIRTFKQLTNLSPTNFFKRVNLKYINKSYASRILIPAVDENELEKTPFYYR